MARRKQPAPRAKLNDGLVNVVANLGTARDKNAHNEYYDSLSNPQEALAAFRNSWLAKAIVTYLAEDATRKWRQWRAESDQIEAIEKLETKLQVKKRIEEGLIAARLFGGAAIYINTNQAEQDQPLEVGEEMDSLVVLSRYSLTSGPIVRDIRSPYYGKPEFYRITTEVENFEIHASRFIILQGDSLPAGSANLAVKDGWSDSVLQSTIKEIKNCDATMANIASLVFEAKVDVLKFEGFAELLAQNGGDASLLRRLQAQAAMKGINGALVIDAKDDYETKSASFGGLPEVARTFMDVVAGASGIPITRLFGRSTVGLSGSGEGDERVYYDRVGHIQSVDVGPAMALFDECLIYQAIGSRPPEVYYEWRALRQLTESERADIFSKTATAARSLAGGSEGAIIPMDVLSEALVNEFTEQGMLPGLDQAIAKYGSLGEQNLGSQDEI